jgi:Bacterial dnaA protein helix-turn-helix
MIAIESTSTESQSAALPMPAVAAPQSPYDRWAEIFARAHDETHSIALALEVLDAIRSLENIGGHLATDDTGRILAVVASLFSVPVKRLRERNRHRDVTDARYVAAFLLRRRHWTTEKTGALFGLDHSTIVTGLQKVEKTPRLLVAVAKAEHLLGPSSAEVAA